MPLSDATKDILSFGAHGRVEDKRNELAELHRKVTEALRERDAALAQANSATDRLIAAKTQAVDILRSISAISKNLKAADRSISEQPTTMLPAVPLAQIEAILEDAEILRHAKSGVLTGASLALGTWALAGTAGLTGAGAALGATGAVIAQTTLTGIGGSALAVGGAAAGAFAIGGLVLLPAAAILAIFSHNSADTKIRELEVEIGKAMVALQESRSVTLTISNIERRAREVAAAIDKTAATFAAAREQCLRRLYPLGIFSRAWKSIRKAFGGNYFSQRDLGHLLPLLQMARILAELIDRRILDEKGNLV